MYKHQSLHLKDNLIMFAILVENKFIKCIPNPKNHINKVK